MIVYPRFVIRINLYFCNKSKQAFHIPLLKFDNVSHFKNHD